MGFRVGQPEVRSLLPLESEINSSFTVRTRRTKKLSCFDSAQTSSEKVFFLESILLILSYLKLSLGHFCAVLVHSESVVLKGFSETFTQEAHGMHPDKQSPCFHCSLRLFVFAYQLPNTLFANKDSRLQPQGKKGNKCKLVKSQ